MSELSLGFQLVGYGLLGVFSVLILFYFMIQLIVRLFPKKDDSEGGTL